MSNIISQTVMV